MFEGAVMIFLADHPLVFLLVSFVLLWVAGHVGRRVRELRPSREIDHDDLSIVLGATLTLLGLIIGFTFSMAVSRYDQRKNYEEEEANAIGTEYLRLDILPSADAAAGRLLLRDYLSLRILYYSTRDRHSLDEYVRRTVELQGRLWHAVAGPVAAQPTPPAALVLSGMNDVLNRQGYTEAAWLNRIPVAAWILLVGIAVLSNVLMGVKSHGKASLVLVILPLILAICFFLVADIDCPHGGIIRVKPQNLELLAASLR